MMQKTFTRLLLSLEKVGQTWIIFLWRIGD